jgi:hypothetical protein
MTRGRDKGTGVASSCGSSTSTSIFLIKAGSRALSVSMKFVYKENLNGFI